MTRERLRGGRTFGWVVVVLVSIVATGSQPAAQRGRGGRGGPAGPPPSGQAGAPVDLTGYWVSLVTEDWLYRMVTPPKGDVQGIALTPAGQKIANAWEPSMDGSCQAYGAAGVMRMPGRLHITWQDENTLKIETDAGQQSRLLHFSASASAPGVRSLQGQSAAQWIRGGAGVFGFGGDVGFGRGGGAGAGARWGSLRVVTTSMTGGWLRKNGVPYSENATMIEHFTRLSEGDFEGLTVTTIVEDPAYLFQSLITSSNFKKEPDGSRWKPSPCRM